MLKTTTLEISTKAIQASLQSPGWPKGHYCILQSGPCPAGFKSISGHLRAINMYSHTKTYIKTAQFGDSKLQCHGNCGQYGHWVGDFFLSTCCKWGSWHGVKMYHKIWECITKSCCKCLMKIYLVLSKHSKSNLYNFKDIKSIKSWFLWSFSYNKS